MGHHLVVWVSATNIHDICFCSVDAGLQKMESTKSWSNNFRIKLTISGTLRAFNCGVSAIVSSVMTPAKSQFSCKQGLVAKTVDKTYLWYTEHSTWTPHIRPLRCWAWLELLCWLRTLNLFRLPTVSWLLLWRMRLFGDLKS